MKTRKTQLSILCLLLAALLCACGQAQPDTPETPAPESLPVTVTVIERFAPPEIFSRADSLAMANYLCGNRALLSGEYLYTLDFDEALQPVLGRYRVVDNGLREFTVLVKNCVAEYLVEDGEALCFIRDGRAERLSLKSGKLSTLCESASTLQLSGGRFYYLDGEGRFCRMETDGSAQTVLFDGPCAYPYVLGDLLLLQKETDGALYLRSLEGEGEWRLSSGGAAYAPLLIGQELYFTQETVDGAKRLCRLDLNEETPQILNDTPLRGTAEFFYRKGWQTRLARSGDLLRQSILTLEAADGPWEDCSYSGYHLLDYVGMNLYVDAIYEADGRLNSFLLAAPDGGSLRYFGGKQLDF